MLLSAGMPCGSDLVHSTRHMPSGPEPHQPISSFAVVDCSSRPGRWGAPLPNALAFEGSDLSERVGVVGQAYGQWACHELLGARMTRKQLARPE